MSQFAPQVKGSALSIWKCQRNNRSLSINEVLPFLPVKVKMKMLLAQLCPTLCDPMDCSPPGSSVHGILQARILEWVPLSFSRGSSQPRDWTQVSCIIGRFFTIWATREVTCLYQADPNWHASKNNTVSVCDWSGTQTHTETPLFLDACKWWQSKWGSM